MLTEELGLLLSSHEINSLLKKTVYKQIEKSKYLIPSCSRYLARVIHKLRLNSWNTKYSQNVTCVCKNILFVKHILLECPITTELFQKNGYDLNAYNNVRDILYNTDVITNIVKSIIHSPVGKISINNNYMFFLFVFVKYHLDVNRHKIKY